MHCYGVDHIMHRLHILNFTLETVLVTLSGLGTEACVPVWLSPTDCSTLAFRRYKSSTFPTLELTSKAGEQFRFLNWNTKLWRASRFKSTWKLVACEDNLPWTVYKLQLSAKIFLLFILPKRSLSSFLADMPSSLPLSSLLLPGTHESVAFYGWPVSQCQDPATPLATQLKSGIRALDIRLSVVNDIIRVVHTFLTSSEGKTETIVMSIKQEDHASTLFSRLVHSAVYSGPGGRQLWFLENRIPTLGEVRGKIVMFSRFGGDGTGWEGGLEGLGVHPTVWPDSKSSGFEWWLKGTKVKTHDWYSIGSFTSIPEKAALSSRILLQPPSPPLHPVLSISFLSAASIPLALPPMIACGFGWPAWGLGVEGVNSRVGKWILKLFASTKDLPEYARCEINKGDRSYLDADKFGQSAEPRLRGWCFMDYYRVPDNVGLVQLLVECNYRGRKAGEEGWS